MVAYARERERYPFSAYKREKRALIERGVEHRRIMTYEQVLQWDAFVHRYDLHEDEWDERELRVLGIGGRNEMPVL